MISPNALRLKRYEAEQKARTVTDLQLMICNFEKTARELEAQILAEEVQTGIKDATHVSYSLFAKAARARREKLRSSVGGLMLHLDAAIQQRDQSAGQLTLTVPRNAPRNSRTGVVVGAAGAGS